jgi:hypothetical protein
LWSVILAKPFPTTQPMEWGTGSSNVEAERQVSYTSLTSLLLNHVIKAKTA